MKELNHVQHHVYVEDTSIILTFCLASSMVLFSNYTSVAWSVLILKSIEFVNVYLSWHYYFLVTE